MKTIENLTKEQDEKLEFYFEKWTKIGLRCGTTTDIDRKEAEKAIFKIYENAKLAKPKILWSRSPVEAIEKLFEMGDKEIKNNFSTFAGFGQHDANWLGFYDFFREELGLREETEEIVYHMELARHCGWWWPYEKACILSEIPISLKMNTAGLLHNTNGPSVEYSDGFCLYNLDGVSVPENIIKAVKGELLPDFILSVTNVEHRLLGIKYVGPERLLKYLNSKVINTKSDEYKLHEFVLEGERCKMLEMQNPSEPKKHYEFVPPEIETVNQALAWRIGWKTFKEPVAKA
jgi:hypothetical protein